MMNLRRKNLKVLSVSLKLLSGKKTENDNIVKTATPAIFVFAAQVSIL